MSKERISSSRNWSVGLQPSAFTTAKSVEEAAVKALAEAYRFTAGTSTPYAPVLGG